ncbi:MAG: class I SAM-dependent methyltransferase [Acidobacteriota bacterium]
MDDPQTFWNAMYAGEDLLYGEHPSAFFASRLAALPPGRMLLPAEGEGRHAVHAARCGWQVDAFDQSDVAVAKALRLAGKAGVSINMRVADFGAPGLDDSVYDLAALLWSHAPPSVRSAGHAAVVRSLRPGGWLLVECFDVSHVELGAGFGPGRRELAYSEDELRRDFAGLEIERLEVVTERFDHGRHDGEGRVVRCEARRPLAESTGS